MLRASIERRKEQGRRVLRKGILALGDGVVKRTPSISRCSECGALLAPGRDCRDYFHDLLALEAEVPGAPGAEPHFLAVATYSLQHPSGFMPSALTGLRYTVADVLGGRATVVDAARRVRAATDGPTRVRRRTHTSLSEPDRAFLRGWPTTWAMTVRDVSEVPPARYIERVRAWATAVNVALDGMR